MRTGDVVAIGATVLLVLNDMHPLLQVLAAACLIAVSGCQIRSSTTAKRPAPTPETIVEYVGSDPQLMTDSELDWSFIQKAIKDTEHRSTLFARLLTTDQYRKEYEELATRGRVRWPSYEAWRINATYEAVQASSPELDQIVADFYFPTGGPNLDQQLIKISLRVVGNPAAHITGTECHGETCLVTVSTATGPLSGGAYEVRFALRMCRNGPVWLPVSERLAAIF